MEKNLIKELVKSLENRRLNDEVLGGVYDVAQYLRKKIRNETDTEMLFDDFVDDEFGLNYVQMKEVYAGITVDELQCYLEKEKIPFDLFFDMINAYDILANNNMSKSSVDQSILYEDLDEEITRVLNDYYHQFGINKSAAGTTNKKNTSNIADIEKIDGEDAYNDIDGSASSIDDFDDYDDKDFYETNESQKEK